MKAKILPSLKILNKLFDCDPEIGLLIRKVKGKGKPVGSSAGWDRHDGYRGVQILGSSYLVHRICYLMYHGVDPGELQVDHINHITSDNRMSNLRLADYCQNGHNALKAVTNSSGIKGVYFHKQNQVWYGRTYKKNKVYSTKSFKTKEEAGDALKILRQQLHGEFTNHG